MVFWHPNGWALVQVIRDYLRRLLAKVGYQEINTPASRRGFVGEVRPQGKKFGDDMFSLATDKKEIVVKPMNCPCRAGFQAEIGELQRASYTLF